MVNNDASTRTLIEAEQWFARLQTGLDSAAERAAYDTWRSRPECAAAYAQTELLWRQIGRLSGDSRIDALRQEAVINTALPAGARRRSWPFAFRPSLAMAASVLIGVVGVAAYMQIPTQEAPATVYETAPGKLRIITLADGSTLHLNVDSAVAVQFTSESRHLVLARGEAFFEVSPDARRPFRVSAGDGNVTALGTRFAVRKQDQHVTVTLLGGHVSVERAAEHESLRMNPGEQVDFTGATAGMEQSRIDPVVAISWARGRLVFRATALATVVAEVNRYADVQLRLADPTLSALPVSGTFPLGDSQTVAVALESVLPVHATPDSSRGIVLSRR